MVRQIILIVAFTFVSFASLASQKIYLVSVGVTDYPGTKYDLRLTVKDAQVVKWVYDKNNRAETVVLTNQAATRSSILQNLNRLYSKAKSQDIIIFFFSGHGYPGGFNLSGEKISYEDIISVMARSKAKNKMIFADACYSGSIREQSSSSVSGSNYKDLNVLLFLSSRSNESSIESPSMENGFFTTYLQKALRGNADVNRDRKVTAKELYNFVSQGVVKISSGRQHPVMWGNFDDSMPVIVW